MTNLPDADTAFKTPTFTDKVLASVAELADSLGADLVDLGSKGNSWCAHQDYLALSRTDDSRVFMFSRQIVLDRQNRLRLETATHYGIVFFGKDRDAEAVIDYRHDVLLDCRIRPSAPNGFQPLSDMLNRFDEKAVVISLVKDKHVVANYKFIRKAASLDYGKYEYPKPPNFWWDEHVDSKRERLVREAQARIIANETPQEKKAREDALAAAMAAEKEYDKQFRKEMKEHRDKQLKALLSFERFDGPRSSDGQIIKVARSRVHLKNPRPNSEFTFKDLKVGDVFRFSDKFGCKRSHKVERISNKGSRVEISTNTDWTIYLVEDTSNYPAFHTKTVITTKDHQIFNGRGKGIQSA